MSDMYEILENCLKEIENGADIDSVLFRYPAYAQELRPLLEASLKAREMTAAEPDSKVVQRNRAKVLQRAAEMREAKVKPSRRIWSVPLRRALVTLTVVGILFVSSTGLVRAASTTVPGDQLYPVKRTWEDVLIAFTFNLQSRQALEVEHENERLSELNELFAEGRSVEVDFSGLVTRQNADLWLVAGIPVAISAQTDLPAQAVAVGDAIHVVGTTQKDGAVLAQKIELLPAGMPLPEVNDDSFEQEEHPGDSQQPTGNGSSQDSEGEAPRIVATQTPHAESESGSSSESEPRDESFDGVVESINGNILVVNGQIINISTAEISGTPTVGASVKVEGYYDANGLFIVTKIEFESSGSDSGSISDGTDKSGSDDTSNSGGGDDHSDDPSSGGDGTTSGGGEP